MDYVIIGNGAAAVGAVEAIRRTDGKGKIIMITDEKHHTYSRPLISYYLLGKVDKNGMKYRYDGFYKDNGVDFLPGVKAARIDPEKKTVITSEGKEIKYGKLLAAAGSAPFVPPIEGLDSVPKRFAFMTMDDAEALESAVNEDSRVLVVGAGLIGLKCAEGISARVKSVTVCDLADRALSSILDAEGAARVQKRMEENGITFKLGASVKKFSGNAAEMTDGSAVSFDALVTAVGVRPNVSLVKDAGGAVGRGITINEKCETTLPDVYAAGDCVEARDASTGEIKIMALLPNAYMQGECAGANMAGAGASFEKAIPMNAIGFFGLHTLTAGAYAGDVYAETDGENYKKLFYSNDRLNGFILMGNVEKGGIYTNLIREGTPLSSIDFSLIKKKPGLMAFSRDFRQAKLGGRENG
jgi:NAD(P)H-nitrite reductase large subunit